MPPSVEKALDARTSRGITGNLDAHLKYKAAEAMGKGGAMDQSLGMGMGAGLGMQMGNRMGAAMGQQGPWGAAPQAGAQQPRSVAPPPPPPVEHVWHIAENGQTRGPFSKADLGRMAASGELTRETHVWTPGQDGWMRAGEVAELAQLFTVMPPPPPPA